MRTSGAWQYMQKNEGNIDTYCRINVSPSDEEVIFKDVMMGRTDPEIFE